MINVSQLEQTIKQYEAEKAQKLSSVRDRVTREKIVPFNADIDNARAKAIAEVNSEMNAKINEINTETNQRISAIRTEYEQKRQELISLGEQRKKQNADDVIANETASITVEYDGMISKLNEILSTIKS